jgi:hypothetical protein
MASKFTIGPIGRHPDYGQINFCHSTVAGQRRQAAAFNQILWITGGSVLIAVQVGKDEPDNAEAEQKAA